MITLALFRERLLKKEEDVENPRILPRILIFIVFIMFLIQILLKEAIDAYDDAKKAGKL